MCESSLHCSQFSSPSILHSTSIFHSSISHCQSFLPSFPSKMCRVFSRRGSPFSSLSLSRPGPASVSLHHSFPFPLSLAVTLFLFFFASLPCPIDSRFLPLPPSFPSLCQPSIYCPTYHFSVSKLCSSSISTNPAFSIRT